jgi:hypothetical protein
VTTKALDEMFSVSGLSRTMMNQKWLIVEDGDHLIFQKLGRWVGKSAKERHLANERQLKSRTAKAEYVTVLSRSKRDKSVTREEKRREDISSSPPTPSQKPEDGGGGDEFCESTTPTSPIGPCAIGSSSMMRPGPNGWPEGSPSLLDDCEAVVV